MAASDYGVLSFKNGKLLDDIDNGTSLIRQGSWGEFKHNGTGLVFYRMSIKDHMDVDKADFLIYMNQELKDRRKKILRFEFKEIQFKTKEIYAGTYHTTFKDNKGDLYQIIHGYDVSLSGFWCAKRGEKVGRLVNRIMK